MHPKSCAASVHVPRVPPASPGGSPRLASRSDPGSLQITASALGSEACEILCAPFKSCVSICLSPLALLKVLLAFKAKCSASSLPKVGTLIWNSDYLLNEKTVIILSFISYPPGGIGQYHISALPTCIMVTFLFI